MNEAYFRQTGDENPRSLSGWLEYSCGPIEGGQNFEVGGQDIQLEPLASLCAALILTC